MPDTRAPSLDEWLAQVRSDVAGHSPDLLSLLDIYAGEARHGRRYIDADLTRLPAGSAILEVGAGSLLLSCQLVREGFRVTSVEPTGSGFSHFSRLREAVVRQATISCCVPEHVDSEAEKFERPSTFDYAFSVNVMEHVMNVEKVIVNVSRSLKAGASYCFTCPNYLFPYEPHFNIPTFFSKKLTWLVFRKRIAGHPMTDPLGTWASLNWINVAQLRSLNGSLDQAVISLNRDLLVSTFERIAVDPEFAARRSPLIRNTILALVSSRLHRLLRYIPAILQPIIDCRVQKTASQKVG